MTETVDPVYRAFRRQAKACEVLGSPMTAFLLRAMADNHQAGGCVHDIVPAWNGDPDDDALPLRLTGALHYAALTGKADALAAFYPSTGGTFTEDGFWDAVETALRDNRPIVDDFLSSPPQTNEVKRSASLLGGFLTVAHETGLPLRCLEIAASAGLNLYWDQFHYTLHSVGHSAGAWGDPASPVHLEADWTGPHVDLSTPAAVASRAGCDVSPIDLSVPDNATRMAAYVWPDQEARFNTLRAAIALFRQNPAPLVQEDAAVWIREKLAEPANGTATVIYHSIAQHYFSDDTMAGLTAAIEEAGVRATADAPVAWLRMELTRGITHMPDLRLQTWPGGEERMLAEVHPHGNVTHWTASENP